MTPPCKPESVSELKSFLGLLSYYSGFLPNASSTLTPLYSLLQSNKKWAWDSKEQTAFDTAKGMLQSTSLLVHYDPTKPLILACDASPYGVGAVLSHMVEDGSENPVAFASRTLSPAEKNYSQLEKEGLAIVYGIRSFTLTCAVATSRSTRIINRYDDCSTSRRKYQPWQHHGFNDGH